jgi:hypothetical protein
MSSTIIFGGRRWCTVSIHRPGRSARAARFYYPWEILAFFA